MAMFYLLLESAVVSGICLVMMDSRSFMIVFQQQPFYGHYIGQPVLADTVG